MCVFLYFVKNCLDETNFICFKFSLKNQQDYMGLNGKNEESQ